MAKTKKPKRKVAKAPVRPKTRTQQQQEVNVYVYRRLDVMEKLVSHMLQKMELVSTLTQQMITTMVILNEKGLVSNEEIRTKREHLMRPLDEQIAGLKNKVEGGVTGNEAGAEETDDSNIEETVDVDTTKSDGDIGTRISESGEVQSEEARTVDGDVRLQEAGLSDSESKRSNQSGNDREITKQSDVSTSLSEPTGAGNKTPHLSLD